MLMNHPGTLIRPISRGEIEYKIEEWNQPENILQRTGIQRTYEAYQELEEKRKYFQIKFALYASYYKEISTGGLDIPYLTRMNVLINSYPSILAQLQTDISNLEKELKSEQAENNATKLETGIKILESKRKLFEILHEKENDLTNEETQTELRKKANETDQLKNVTIAMLKSFANAHNIAYDGYFPDSVTILTLINGFNQDNYLSNLYSKISAQLTLQKIMGNQNT